jgi:hypothetical protein
MGIDPQIRDTVSSAEPSDAARGRIGEQRWLWQDCAAALALFAATAAVVLWQNSRLAVLWDLSYILENAFRISLGGVPYRDFPLPYAPLTFLTQAALIKLTGRVFFHHVLYCAAMGGVATVLTWRVLLNILLGAVRPARTLAFLLSAPLTVLGIYCVFPHPFYDCDCTFAILVCILLLQSVERRGFPPLPALFTGAALVIPLFVKQNTGAAFLASAGLALVALITINLWQRRPARGMLWLIVGAAAGLLAALSLVQLTVGLDNYTQWTIRFAASRRMPPLAEMLAVYRNPVLLWWMAALLAGIVIAFVLYPQSLAPSRARHDRFLALLSGLLVSSPFLWVLVSQFLEHEPSERAESLLALWPFLLIVSFLCALLSAGSAVSLSSTRCDALRISRRRGIALVLPFVVIGTILGAFLSQQLWGSTYAIWPLLMLLFADVVATLVPLLNDATGRRSVAIVAVAAISMIVSGGLYVYSHERLDYADLSQGPLVRSNLPALKGLSVRGQWLPQFEELLRYCEREIPERDGILMIPGEDLFYYTTGRLPQFPVLMFDHTVNPYSPEEILQLSRSRNIRWLIVKRELQLQADPVENKGRMLELLRQDFAPVETLDNYDIYRRKSR